MISEEEELMCEVIQSGRTKKKSIEGDVSIMVTSTIGLTTEIRLSEMDEMIRQGPATSRSKVPLFGGNFWGCELPPRKELIAQEDFPPEASFT